MSIATHEKIMIIVNQKTRNFPSSIVICQIILKRGPNYLVTLNMRSSLNQVKKTREERRN